MDEYTLKYLHDVLDAITEVEGYFAGRQLDFDTFLSDLMLRSAVERKVEIMGEALNRVMQRDPNFSLANARAIVRTRNRVIHEYDRVEPEFLWGLVIRHIPQLKADILALLS